MSFQIERGLFKFDFTDYHAILGVPVDADAKEVRKQYLKIARLLHPDSSKSSNESDKQLANSLLTKLVNPAYEQLSRSNREYMVSLGHLGKRMSAEGGKVAISSEPAKQLAKSGANFESFYKNTLKKLASTQYESLPLVSDKIAEISELNLVYLMLKGKSGQASPVKSVRATGNLETKPPTPGNPQTPTNPASNHPQPTASKPGVPNTSSEVSRADTYINRAEGYMEKKNFAGAVLELREALKLDQTNSKCHSLLGTAYLQQKQVSMARVHINKALELNPKDELALKCKQFIDKQSQESGSDGQSKHSSQSQNKSSGQSSSGGFLGGLFGGGKKK
ncbi:MAG TPA: molecular chaperone DnaJ [Cyanobacteria bacterium UBA11149]|nr:molecular chaperone DnaJ [Cyanobacteria bacterium UBA11367]HBE60143.1 molecular chaperone DnaJ [Cyanobacteria bacterium UBA11366]HBK64816.1 molecular chaperone DnaJ [Cyanobacteria bacterium UBA11166]HBR74215.1 molecular chaperone DnaJ [Cyanobacteria bacterium UBA11159]HBS70701.1 molecular chaperone DnaJ [Cyanobacteria bacterium UBA11153]HBW90393.1 molecular chaperone DnaJ [Cyanobacteria bacterium UBA11149]HCA93167.1 molecular chaperone DnaJ [Cyanobacteria bacterium UBA9226]